MKPRVHVQAPIGYPPRPINRPSTPFYLNLLLYRPRPFLVTSPSSIFVVVKVSPLLPVSHLLFTQYVHDQSYESYCSTSWPSPNFSKTSTSPPLDSASQLQGAQVRLCALPAFPTCLVRGPWYHDNCTSSFRRVHCADCPTGIVFAGAARHRVAEPGAGCTIPRATFGRTRVLPLYSMWLMIRSLRIYMALKQLNRKQTLRSA